MEAIKANVSIWMQRLLENDLNIQINKNITDGPYFAIARRYGDHKPCKRKTEKI